MVAPMKHASRLPVLALALAACGPNYRYVYDGEAAFERCYALDYDEGSTAPTRQQCWSAWLQSYSFGAGADRVDYARAHVNGQPQQPAVQTPQAAMAPLATAPSAPTMEPLPPPPAGPPTSAPAMTQQAASAWRREQISVGGNPVAAPPPTATPTAPESEPPGASCATECHATWHACGTRCTGNDAACIARCDDGYRECMRGCF
jgi:hypothetical protein